MDVHHKRPFSTLLCAASAVALVHIAPASAAAVSCTPEEAALIAKGAQSWERRCAGCHSLDKNRIGPKHRGVYGRKAGAVEDFKYSKALRTLNVVWTDKTLDPWLTSPIAFAPGTSMGLSVEKPADRAAIIAWLKSVSPGSGSCAP